MISLLLIFVFVLFFGFVLSIGHFLNNLIILESLNVLVLLFCLLFSTLDSHMIFIALIVVSTIEVVVGLVILTQVWECSSSLDLVCF
uniref:NADH dehydrogenase subunit 4L n=1 Tax=Hydatigera parva TaxID=1434711 RepID=N0DLF3_9CEST|nr:NADH dehydrogenase subunit 4L [Hydatigera parva]BAN15656.1 NADH dehydrogenase subunit 4L [Hydatigera parva]